MAEITKEEGEKAVTALVRRYNASKPHDVLWTALIEATRASDIDCKPLTAVSTKADLKSACEAVAVKLESEWAQKTFSGSKKNAALLQSKTALFDQLSYPASALLDALAKELRAGEDDGAAGGGAVARAMQAVLAAQRVHIAKLVIMPTDATGKDACLLLLDLFNAIRTAHLDVSAHLRARNAEPRRRQLATVCGLTSMPLHSAGVGGELGRRARQGQCGARRSQGQQSDQAPRVRQVGGGVAHGARPDLQDQARPQHR